MNRVALAVIGALGGLAVWLLAEVLEDVITNARLLLVLVTLVAGFFGSFLALAGPLNLRRAGAFAAVIGLVLAVLLFWASFRFDDVGGFLESGHVILAATVLMSLSLPFAIAHSVSPSGWRDYAALFNHAWSIVVRYMVAAVFVGIFWGVVLLSDMLLNIVGVEIIDWIIKLETMPYLLTGGAVGLAIAVVNELSDYVSPYLIFRLLRLLLPIFVVVIAVFVVALPLRGLDGVFQGLSEAATMVTIVIFGLTLVTVAVATDNDEAVDGRLMKSAVAVLSLLMPIVAALAVYAVWVRVAQYGWTPTRLLAAVIAVISMIYAVSYGVSILLRGQWMARIRRINIYLALVVMAITLLWLTPILNAERISTNSQISRYENGKINVEDFDLWEIGREWGKAGTAGLEYLKQAADHPDHARLLERIAQLDAATSSYDFRRSQREVAEATTAIDIQAELAVLPDGATLPDGAMKSVSGFNLSRISDGCARLSPAGAPGCAAIVVNLTHGNDAPEVVFAYLTDDGDVALGAARRYNPEGSDFRYDNALNNDLGNRIGRLPLEAFDAIIAGEFSVAPANIDVLKLGDVSIFIQP